MIFTLILFLAFVVFLAFFVGLNIGNVCTFWFFKTYTDVPAAVLVLIAFGAGIIVAILFMLISKLRGPSPAEIEKKEELRKKREAAKLKAEAKAQKLIEKQRKNEEKAKKNSKEKEEAFSEPVEVPTVKEESADK
ncbi:MAG: lipopolysaccharide assembly protein LapA domain-containing protein [Treponema sp.]|nr:lipopolysaccharide assembly protein LapA domain-containing protein [Treponema sp.]